MQITLIKLHNKISDIQRICFHIKLPLSQKRLADTLFFGIMLFQIQLVGDKCNIRSKFQS